MTLVEHLKIKKLNLLVVVTALLFLATLLFSGGLYLTKMKNELKENIRVLEIAKYKILRITMLEQALKRISLSKYSTHYAVEVARLADTINAKFPEAKLELQDPAIDGKEAVFNFTVKGGGNFRRFSELVGFFEQEGYPVIFLKKLSLRENGNVLEYEISGEIRSIL
ncbi:MAG: hypothetical protein N2317_07055 [Syntrophales bacterium]|nr:hypothetical protein [Syntrophales bacterium]